MGPDLLTTSEETGQETITNLTDQVRLPTEKSLERLAFKMLSFGAVKMAQDKKVLATKLH